MPYKSPEAIANRKAYMKEYRQRPDVKARAKELDNTQERKNKKKVRDKRYQQCSEVKSKNRTRCRQCSANLDDLHIKRVLWHYSIKNPPHELIEAKREHLKMKRLIKEMKNEKPD